MVILPFSLGLGRADLLFSRRYALLSKMMAEAMATFTTLH